MTPLAVAEQSQQGKKQYKILDCPCVWQQFLHLPLTYGCRGRCWLKQQAAAPQPLSPAYRALGLVQVHKGLCGMLQVPCLQCLHTDQALRTGRHTGRGREALTTGRSHCTDYYKAAKVSPTGRRGKPELSLCSACEAGPIC